MPHLRVEQSNHHFHNGKWKELTGDFGNFYFAVFGKYSTGIDNGEIVIRKNRVSILEPYKAHIKDRINKYNLSAVKILEDCHAIL